MKTIAILFTLSFCASIDVFARTKPRNIVLIYADDLGFGDLGCYGAKKIPTPHLDRLATEGIRFTDGHAAASTCTPSRYAMLTGKYAWRQKGTNILPGDAPLIIKPGTPTLATLLRDAGYKTGLVGKWHLGLGNGTIDWNKEIVPGPLDVGFDEAFLVPATQDRVPCVYIEGRRVVNLDSADPISVNYYRPLDDQPTGKSNPGLLKMKGDGQHNGTIINGIARIGYMAGGKSALWSDVGMADELTGRAVKYIERNKERSFFLFFAQLEPHQPRTPHPRFVGRTTLGSRGDVIVQLDWCVGEILNTLDRLGLANDTLVIFSSDNGPVLHDGYADQAAEKNRGHQISGPYRGGKYDAYEGGTRVPLIVRWPAQVRPGISSALISQMDFPVTLSALANVSLPHGAAPDSQNLLPALLGESAAGRQILVEQGMIAWGLRDNEWKLVQPINEQRTSAHKMLPVPKPMLFNLSMDPGETQDLSTVEPVRFDAMRKLLSDAVGSSPAFR